MRTKKELSYKIDAEQFEKLHENGDFVALIQMGRMLNAFELTTEAARELLAEKDSHKVHMRQASAVLSRLATEAMNLTGRLAPFYHGEPFFEHLAEMFSGQVREIEPKPISRVILPEFRLYSIDPEVSRILRNLDIIGVEIVFPTDQNRIADVLECEGETHYELGKYAILRPKEHVERQILRVMFTFVQDFTEGATMFIEGLALKLKLNTPKPKTKRTSRTTGSVSKAFRG